MSHPPVQQPAAAVGGSAAGVCGGVGGHARPASASGLKPQQQQAGGLPWLRPKPDVLQLAPSEMKWLHAQPAMGLLWNSTLAEDANQVKVVRELIARALVAPLLPAQQQAVLAQMESDPKLVHNVGLTPQQLPALVEHTPILAYEVLLRLMRSRHIHAYLQVLAQMELSLHSMEVVNRLTSSAELPTEFVHLYITNCINSCEGIQDKYLQNRLVRLVCVFLQSLIRNKIINIAALLHEVQAFCINFSRIREAATLFRVLKQMELGAGSPGSSGVAASKSSQASDGLAAGFDASGSDL